MFINIIIKFLSKIIFICVMTSGYALMLITLSNARPDEATVIETPEY